ncbi:MAG: gpW family protein [Desulfotalea sp.]
MATVPKTVREKRDEAVEAYHRVSIGTMAYKTVIDGDLVEFGQANSDKMYVYIGVLSAQLGEPNPLDVPDPITVFEVFSSPGKGY